MEVAELMHQRPDELLSTRDVMRLTGVTFRVLDWWDRVGVICPVREARGSGTQRGWSGEQIEIIRVIDWLRRMRAESDVLGAVVHFIGQHGFRAGQVLTVGVDGTIRYRESMSELDEPAWVVPLPLQVPGQERMTA